MLIALIFKLKIDFREKRKQFRNSLNFQLLVISRDRGIRVISLPSIREASEKFANKYPPNIASELSCTNLFLPVLSSYGFGERGRCSKFVRFIILSDEIYSVLARCNSVRNRFR